MKLFTDEIQTAKLIELGFEKPKSVTEISWQEIEKDNPIINANTIEYTRAYSIGELIEMLPKSLKNPYNPPLAIEWNGKWRVYYGVPEEYSWEWSIWYEEERKELIDALYDMCVRLKEKGVI